MTQHLLGAEKYPVWLHHGSQLTKCHMIRIKINFLDRLFKRMQGHKVKWEQVMKDGRGLLHGETVDQR